jgi:[acyl-carrier-protein] S-malonyltransferase
MKRALVFPGQASQYVGMAKDIYDKHESVKDMYAKAQDILGFDIAKVTFEGPLEELTQTKVTQPALFITSAAFFSLLPKDFDFSMVAGHSLGEYSALYASGVLSFEDALSIVKVRAEGMHAAGIANPGTMAAILNQSREQVAIICEHGSKRGIVQAANYNSPGQIVISGDMDGVHFAMEVAKNLGARKVIALNVSGAFHSPLMAPAKVGLSKAIAKATFNPGKVPVVANVNAEPITDPELIKQNLIDQLESPVLWEDTIVKMKDMGISDYVEVGPGKVLQGLIRRIDRESNAIGVGSIEELEGLTA